MKLNALTVRSISKPGRYADGGGLYLLVKPSGSKYWVFRYMIDRARKDMGLGPLSDLPLAEARRLALEHRQAILAGSDPLKAKEQARKASKEPLPEVITFEHCLLDYINSQKSGWKTEKQARDIEASFRNHAADFLKLPVSSITFDHVASVLEPLWGTKTETGTRIQSRMEAILGLAKVRGYRSGDNPAAWKGNLCFKFAKRSAAQPVKHFEAMSREELPKFFAMLSDRKHTSYQALRFIILTCARTGQALGATWPEIDLQKRIWIIPGERMKTGREHRVPLSDPAIAILEHMKSWVQGEWVFPSVKNWDGPISNMACMEVMREHKRRETVHGFRSTFKDWAAECTQYPNEVSEMALAHSVSGKVEAAYRRGDLLEKRVQIMNDWADFCTSMTK